MEIKKKKLNNETEETVVSDFFRANFGVKIIILRTIKQIFFKFITSEKED